MKLVLATIFISGFSRRRLVANLKLIRERLRRLPAISRVAGFWPGAGAVKNELMHSHVARFTSALDQKRFDLIFADGRLQGLGGLAALKKPRLEVPARRSSVSQVWLSRNSGYQVLNESWPAGQNHQKIQPK